MTSHFRVTAFLHTPIGGYGERPQLDSLLAYTWARESLPMFAPPSRSVEPDLPPRGDLDVYPLEVVTVADGTWWWDGTAGHGAVRAVDRREHRKRFASRRATDWTTARTANIAAGLLKGIDLPIPTVLLDQVVFWGSGDPVRVQDMLDRYVHGLGKRHNSGLGMVDRWLVEEIGEGERRKEEVMAFGDGPRRPVPAEMHPDWPIVRDLRLHPPYWHPHGAVLCAVPEDWGAR